jgi:hypothetical protein
MNRQIFAAVLVACMSLSVFSTPARAQDVINKEAAAEVKAQFLADLETMRGKFIGLAEAFPQDKYTWRPMEGVRSVSEVFMLAAMEGYGFIPNGFGGKPQPFPGGQPAAAKVTDKKEVIDHLTKGFAYAKAQLEAIDPATLTGKRTLMGQPRSTTQIALLIGGDLHEHLGQMIAYARMNKIVPPWSK